MNQAKPPAEASDLIIDANINQNPNEVNANNIGIKINRK